VLCELAAQPAGCFAQQITHQEHGGRETMPLHDGPCVLAEVLVAIVKREDHRFAGQGLAFKKAGTSLIKAENREIHGFEVGHLRPKAIDMAKHGAVCRWT